jgi:hypothetical protein
MDLEECHFLSDFKKKFGSKSFRGLESRALEKIFFVEIFFWGDQDK